MLRLAVYKQWYSKGFLLLRDHLERLPLWSDYLVVELRRPPMAELADAIPWVPYYSWASLKRDPDTIMDIPRTRPFRKKSIWSFPCRREKPSRSWGQKRTLLLGHFPGASKRAGLKPAPTRQWRRKPGESSRRGGFQTRPLVQWRGASWHSSLNITVILARFPIVQRFGDGDVFVSDDGFRMHAAGGRQHPPQFFTTHRQWHQLQQKVVHRLEPEEAGFDTRDRWRRNQRPFPNPAAPRKFPWPAEDHIWRASCLQIRTRRFGQRQGSRAESEPVWRSCLSPDAMRARWVSRFDHFKPSTRCSTPRA